ncbi:MAG TPA: hypothetical protein VFN74_14450, partial [Chloroflexota bacterium]|nr:hypothetical protein [Chloroflexota bacterium]
KILAMFVAGNPPDTHVLDMPKVQAYARREVILPLTPFMKEDKSFKTELLHKREMGSDDTKAFIEGRVAMMARWISGTGLYFSDAANQEVIKQLTAIKTCETPTMTVDLMKKGNSFVRLLSVDEEQINRLINAELNPMWAGEVAPPTAAKKAADVVNDFLKANPQ